jgi:2-oxoglutarate ferredoxin oxidoreductase subunit gamma
MRAEVRVSGFGGQGVILCAHIMGKAASIFADGQATMTQAFGPEARGSACSAQVVISDDVVQYPYVTRPSVLIAMSQDACDKFLPQVEEGGLLLIEEDLVKPKSVPDGVRVLGVPATRFAEELGRKIVLNIVMFGFFAATSGLLTEEAAREAVRTSVPAGTEELNLAAFDKGFDHGKSLLN